MLIIFAKLLVAFFVLSFVFSALRIEKEDNDK
jgi:hypothetical protein